jgi:signal transduction histidine kinase
MVIARHKRQIVLFLVAIVVPASVLIVLAGRIMIQDRELAAKRAADQRLEAVGQLRRELTASLEAIKLQEVNRLIRSPDQSQDSGNQAVVFSATLDGDRLVLPSEVASLPDSAAFAQHRQEGETQEFAKRDNAAAVAAYRLARSSARRPAESAEARLLLARALFKAGNVEEASQIYQTLLGDSFGARDDQGVGYGFYAAQRLMEMKRAPDSVSSFLRKEVDGETRLTLPELYMIRDDLAGADPSARSSKLEPAIAQGEQAVALARDFPHLRAQIEAGTNWVSYGEEPWLVAMAPPAPHSPGLVVAVSSAKAAPPGVKLKAHVTEGDALGDAFPGLRVEWPDNRFSENARQGVPLAIWIAGLALVLGIAVFGGYLLLRDVNRDVRMTEVRAQFIASVSHELKTPLTAIRMFAETLSLGRSRDERTKAEYLETIVNESERLARLVDNVLDFSKIEQGKKIYRFRPTRLEDVAGSAIRAMQFPLEQEGFRLHFSVQEEIPELQADPDAIQQAILNLLTNAMKYSGDSREIDVRVGARNGDAVIEVADRGLGLGPDEQKHVFENFYRAPSHEARLIAGTGLGLTLVAHIAKAHGGRVEVESAPGAGSTFSILLPVNEGNSAESDVHT